MEKAPDKIYIYREPPKDYFEDGWVESKADDVESVPYIRKEALLEWAKAKHMELDPPQNERDFGRIEAVEELIDKINSL